MVMSILIIVPVYTIARSFHCLGCILKRNLDKNYANLLNNDQCLRTSRLKPHDLYSPPRDDKVLDAPVIKLTPSSVSSPTLSLLPLSSPESN